MFSDNDSVVNTVIRGHSSIPLPKNKGDTPRSVLTLLRIGVATMPALINPASTIKAMGADSKYLQCLQLNGMTGFIVFFITLKAYIFYKIKDY